MAEITIREIAKECGVSVSTVSRALNNHPDINAETKKIVNDAIERLGYIPNNSARNLKRTDAKCIAVLIKGITNPFFSGMIKIFEETTLQKHYALILRHVPATEDEVDAALELIKEKRLRGIIFLGGNFTHDEKKLAQIRVPYVFSTVNCPRAGDLPYSSISVDDRAESRRLVEYLIREGHRRIAILTDETNVQNIGRLRLQGYEDALQAAGIPLDPGLIFCIDREGERYFPGNGYRTTQRLLASGADFTAVFAISDTIAYGVCRALLDAHLRIPQDVSVVGFDGIPMSDYCSPRLTTLRQPIEQIARRSMELLFAGIDEQPPQQLTLEGELIVQESSGPVPQK